MVIRPYMVIHDREYRPYSPRRACVVFSQCFVDMIQTKPSQQGAIRALTPAETCLRRLCVGTILPLLCYTTEWEEFFRFDLVNAGLKKHDVNAEMQERPPL
jgi:hypothetical protein